MLKAPCSELFDSEVLSCVGEFLHREWQQVLNHKLVSNGLCNKIKKQKVQVEFVVFMIL